MRDSAGKIQVLYDPGFDLDSFRPTCPPNPIREEFGVYLRWQARCTCSKNRSAKGHPTLIRAVPRILSQIPNARFVIVGGEVSGRTHRGYAEELRSLVEELDVGRAVEFAGFRRDIADIMNAADILLQCSIYPDPFPGVVLQSMFLGKAVVATRIGGAIEQIEHEVSGLLIRPDDDRQLADSIIRLLKDDDLCRKLGSAASKRVADDFGFDRYQDQWLAVYSRLYEAADTR